MLTKERAYALNDFLAENQECAKQIESVSAEEAVEVINANGFDYTVEEFTEFAKAFEAAQPTGELDENALENVAGGSIVGHYLRGVYDGTRQAIRDWARRKVDQYFGW